MARILDALISLAVFVTWIVVGIVITFLALLPLSAIILGIFTFWGWNWFFIIPFGIIIFMFIILLASIDTDAQRGVFILYFVLAFFISALSLLILNENLG